MKYYDNQLMEGFIISNIHFDLKSNLDLQIDVFRRFSQPELNLQKNILPEKVFFCATKSQTESPSNHIILGRIFNPGK